MYDAKLGRSTPKHADWKTSSRTSTIELGLWSRISPSNALRPKNCKPDWRKQRLQRKTRGQISSERRKSGNQTFSTGLMRKRTNGDWKCNPTLSSQTKIIFAPARQGHHTADILQIHSVSTTG